MTLKAASSQICRIASWVTVRFVMTKKLAILSMKFGMAHLILLRVVLTNFMMMSEIVFFLSMKTVWMAEFFIRMMAATTPGFQFWIVQKMAV